MQSAASIVAERVQSIKAKRNDKEAVAELTEIIYLMSALAISKELAERYMVLFIIATSVPPHFSHRLAGISP